MEGIREADVEVIERCDAIDGARVRDPERVGEETSRNAGMVREGDGKGSFV